MNCQEFEELSGAYALEALSEDEREVADEHLTECPKCTRSFQQLRTVVDLLPLAVPAVEPPPHLKAQIIARIRQGEAERERVIEQDVRVRRRRRRWNVALLASAAALMLALLGGMLSWNISLQGQVARLYARAPMPVVYTMHGTGENAGASGQVIYFPQQDITVLIVHGLPELSGTQVYQGWLIQGKTPKSIGLLNVQNGVATVDFAGDFRGYDAAAVSLETGPVASKDAPGGPVVVVGRLGKLT